MKELTNVHETAVKKRTIQKFPLKFCLALIAACLLLLASIFISGAMKAEGNRNTSGIFQPSSVTIFQSNI